MRFLTTTPHYDFCVMIAPKNSNYRKPVIFHTYWDNPQPIPTEKLLLSIQTCRYHHPGENVSIQVWVPKELQSWISEYQSVFQIYGCTLHVFELEVTCANVQNTILYEYGGCWFAPTLIFLRALDPLFWTYGTQIMIHHDAELKNTCTNIMVSLTPKCPIFKQCVQDGLAQVNPCGTIEEKVHLPTILVLPCSWFHGISMKTKYIEQDQYAMVFHPQSTPFEWHTFYKGSYTICIEDQWDTPIQEHSIMHSIRTLVTRS